MKKSPLAILYYVLLIGFVGSLVITPIFHSLNRIEPRIFGFPFIMIWLVIVNFVAAGSLLGLTLLDERKEG